MTTITPQTQTQESNAFWQPISLDDMAVQQGVSAASDLDEISALWPADDDPDEMIEHIGSDRGARRMLSERHKANTQYFIGNQASRRPWQM